MIDPKLRLKKQIERGQVPHLLVFQGDKEIIEQAALDFAHELLGAKSSPDLHLVAPEGKLALHSTASLSRMLAAAAFKPAAGSHQIFILEEAERMLPAASNQLLKTLEEPTSSAIFILLTSHSEKLLATLRSRAQLLSFPSSSKRELSASQKELFKWLQQGTGYSEIERFCTEWESRKKSEEKEAEKALPAAYSPKERELLMKEIEASLALHCQEEFFSLLELIARYYRDLNLLHLAQSPTQSLYFDHPHPRPALPYREVERMLGQAKVAYQRSMPLLAIFERLAPLLCS